MTSAGSPTTADAPPRTGGRLARALAVGVLFLLTFGLHARLSFELYERGAFARNDLLFDADSGDRLHYFSAYEGAPPKAYPNLFTLTNVFVALGASAAERAGVEWAADDPADPHALHRRVALLVTPLCSGLQAVVIYLLALTLGLRGWRALALSATSACWFSNLVFGSLPDTYGVVSLFLALLFWVAARAIVRRRAPAWATWIVAGALVTSLLTNAVIAGIVILVTFVHLGMGPGVALRRALLVSGAFVVLALGVAWTVERVHPRATVPVPVAGNDTIADGSAASGGGNRITRWFLRFDPVERFFEHFPLAVGTSLVAPGLVVGPPLETDGPEVEFRIVTPVAGEASPWQWPLLALVWASVVLGGLALARAGGAQRTLAVLGSLVLAYNWVFHTVWGGHDLFLYSQNWICAVTLLAGGNLLVARAGRFHLALFAVLAAAAVGANFLRVREILAAFPPAA